MSQVKTRLNVLLKHTTCNQGPVILEQSKEERDAKTAKIYLGNVKVVWSNGQNVDAAPREDNRGGMSAPAPSAVDDLPF